MENKSVHIQPFLMVSAADTYEQVKEKLQKFKAMGISSSVLQYADAGIGKDENDPAEALMKISKFNDTYFRTLDRLIRACRELNMTFWVQDAAPFPTGAANGWFCRPQYLHKGKVYLQERHTNVAGPVKNGVLLAENFIGLPRGSVSEIMSDIHPVGPEASRRGELLGVVAMKKSQDEISFDYRTAIDLTHCLDEKNGILRFDLPEGEWRIFFLYRSFRGGRKYYMNLLDKESVKIHLEAVLKLHYEKLQQELGKTWEGFFYDEPEVGNTENYDFFCRTGYSRHKTPISLPWCDALPGLLEQRLGNAYLTLLPCLWYPCGEITGKVQYHYMDIVTSLISENYNGTILPWCRERNIRYIGHVLEDEGSHTRLGCGAGHFFRVEKHQDMAGIDLIGGQLQPGLDSEGMSWYGCADGNGEFYHYGIAKLASSEAHINPDKCGRSFCEINALYNDVSDGKFYKFLLDHLFVNGINHLVPVITEVLKEKEGNILFTYAEKMCGFLQNGQHQAVVGILYHAESEWAGETREFTKPARELAGNQIDYDVLPADVFRDRDYYRCEIKEKKFIVNGHEYRGFIIPECRCITEATAEFIKEAVRKNIPVLAVDALPVEYCETCKKLDWEDAQPEIAEQRRLGEILQEKGIFDIRLGTKEKYLRYMHIRKNSGDYYMFLNEEPYRNVRTEIIFPQKSSVYQYDIIRGTYQEVSGKECQEGLAVEADFGQYESRIYVQGIREDSIPKDLIIRREAGKKDSREWKLDHAAWKITLSEASVVMKSKELTDISLTEGLERYTGSIVYETSFDISGSLPTVLDLGNVCDSAQVWLNGRNVGICIASPYQYRICGIVKEGMNKLTINVTPGQGRQKKVLNRPDLLLSAVPYSLMPGTGLLGPVTLR